MVGTEKTVCFTCCIVGITTSPIGTPPAKPLPGVACTVMPRCHTLRLRTTLPLPCTPSLPADLVALLQASAAPLVQLLAAEMERGQERRGSQTVGARFRDQLRDLIQRLDA